jgi:hypothetical protein
MVSIEGVVDVRQPSPSYPTFVLKSSLLQMKLTEVTFMDSPDSMRCSLGCSKHIGGYFFTFVTMVGAKTTAASQY